MSCQASLCTSHYISDEVLQVIEGRAIVIIRDDEYILTAGEMIVMPAKIPHGIKAIENTKILLLRPKHKHK